MTMNFSNRKQTKKQHQTNKQTKYKQIALFNILLGETTAFSVFGAVKTCKESHIKKLNFSFRDPSTSSFPSKVWIEGKATWDRCYSRVRP